MTFDAMAAAVDWLDAYRAADIEALLSMYGGDAVIDCGCGGLKSISGHERFRAYWENRLRDYPAFDLEDLQLSSEGVAIAYISRNDIVSATLDFGPHGKITRHGCGPLKQAIPLCRPTNDDLKAAI
jgi:ketosteroid isomerase-like protein